MTGKGSGRGGGERKRQSLAKGSSLLIADKGAVLAAGPLACAGSVWAALPAGGADRSDAQ